MSTETVEASSPETASKSAAPSAPRDPLRELTDLLSAERAEAAPAEKPAEKSAAKGKPRDFQSLAERLGLEVKDLYDVEVPSARKGVEPYKLGKLKDLAAEQDDFAIRSLSLDEDRRKFETDRVTAETEIQTALAMLPADSLKPEKVKQFRDMLAGKRAQESQRTLDSIPEWRDETVRTKELGEIAEHLKGYGLSDSLLLQNFSHQFMRYVRENYRREKSVQAALARIKERPPTTPPKAAPQVEKSGKRLNGAAPSTRQAQQVSDFMATINNSAGARR